MKIVIADKFQQSGLDALQSAGFEVISGPQWGPKDLPGVFAEHDPDVLVVRSTKVQAAAIDAAKSLKLIVRAGAGYDTIDVAHASRRGVFVANCPAKNAIAVAELAWGLILSCDRRIPDQTQDLRAGQWNKKKYSKARGLHGRTLGLLGFGSIAREVAIRARAFGMPVVAWSRSLTKEKAKAARVTHASSPKDVAAVADVLSIHVASTADTKHLLGTELINALKPGSYVINTSRGAVVDEQALTRGIAEKGLRAGLDVFESEPGTSQCDYDNAIAKEAGVYCSHHIGASTDQAQEAIAAEAVRVIQHFHEHGEVVNCVNRAKKTSATCLLTVRHLNRPGVLAKVFGVLGQADINVDEMENLLYQGEEAACARIMLDSDPSAEQIELIRGACKEILGVELSTLN